MRCLLILLTLGVVLVSSLKSHAAPKFCFTIMKEKLERTEKAYAQRVANLETDIAKTEADLNEAWQRYHNLRFRNYTTAGELEHVLRYIQGLELSLKGLRTDHEQLLRAHNTRENARRRQTPK